MRYLRKRSVYAIACTYLPYKELPPCSDCEYKAHSGFEWLSFYLPGKYVTLSVYRLNKYYRLVERTSDDAVIFDKVFSRVESLALLDSFRKEGGSYGA